MQGFWIKKFTRHACMKLTNVTMLPAAIRKLVANQRLKISATTLKLKMTGIRGLAISARYVMTQQDVTKRHLARRALVHIALARTPRSS